MLIDGFLPEFQIRSHHETVAAASPAEVYRQLQILDLRESGSIRWLLRLRGMPRETSTLKGMRDSMFTLLGEIPARELVLGIVGRFWTLRGQLQKVPASDFKDFSEEGFAKAAWNFSIEPERDDRTRLRTETRILCLDPGSLRSFRRYWTFVGPFSGWTRREMLRIVKRNAERAERARVSADG